MSYAITGLTKKHEYEIAVDIISKHKRINPEEFKRASDNIFGDKSEAEAVLAKLNSHPDLQSCPFGIYKTED